MRLLVKIVKNAYILFDVIAATLSQELKFAIAVVENVNVDVILD
jgi:acid phosphatase family membrane protein YuiD